MAQILASWMVKVKAAYEIRAVSGWESHYYRPMLVLYVVARTRASAIRQAKRLAGYVSDEDCSSKRDVHHLERLEIL